jgi:hypothetical protein
MFISENLKLNETASGFPYASSTDSAEWIVESPSENNYVVPSFSQILFSSSNIGPQYNGYKSFGVFGTFGAKVVPTGPTPNGDTLYRYLNTAHIVSCDAFDMAYGQEVTS